MKTDLNADQPMDVEQAVRERYSRSSKHREEALCCPSQYDDRFLAVLPEEIVQKDYGCGDPTAWCEPGQTVLDLGSGGGKACYIISQKVGPQGHVIGVDMNDDMLALAEKHRAAIAQRIGYANVEFRKGKIQDLRLDHAKVDGWLRQRPIRTGDDLAAFEAFCRESAADEPLIDDDSIDLIVSNCVLNLVRPEDRGRLFAEMLRVLRRGGRAVISDIVCDEIPPEALQRDPDLWSGCISGAYREDLFLKAFEDAGFHGIEILKYDKKPWQTIAGIEFRSITVSAYNGKYGPCFEHREAVIYKGPFSAVHDDDGHRYPRGARVAVCRKTFDLLRTGPYRDVFVFVEPREPIAPQDAKPFDCARSKLRDPRETKGADYAVTTEAASDCCGPNCC